MARWRESGIATPTEREQAALRKVNAWLELPLSERVKRKDAYRHQLARCEDCGARLMYSRRPDDRPIKVA